MIIIINYSLISIDFYINQWYIKNESVNYKWGSLYFANSYQLEEINTYICGELNVILSLKLGL